MSSAGASARRVQDRIRSYGRERAVVALSGGVDSSTVLALAAAALGPHAVAAITAVSPSLPSGELEAAGAVVTTVGVEHRTVPTFEVDREAYARNDAMRCFHCKTELYVTLNRVAEEDRKAVVLAGANADDAGDFRPGLMAASRHRVRNPLLEVGVGKAEVRAIARSLGLPVADKPALACLSSRVAYGIPITPDLLARIDRAEQQVRAMGFDQVRVRHLGEEASIEVPAERVTSLQGHPLLDQLAASLRTMGWATVTVDPDGYRMGSMNATLTTLELRPPAWWARNPQPAKG